MTNEQKKFFLTLLDTIKTHVNAGNLADVESLFSHGVSAAQAAISDTNGKIKND